MCIKPNYVWVERGPRHEKQIVPCRKCWRCKKNRLNDYVGKCLAEATESDWVRAITLTYAPTSPENPDTYLAEHVITKSHFQDFVRAFRKPMRKRGHVLRYLAVGEYGKLKGRAHFHALLFGTGDAPEIPLKKNWHIPQWPHGHVYVDGNGGEDTIRYVAKYLLKDSKDVWFTCSKYPPLGDAFFAKLAKRNYDLGTWPSSFKYMPPGGNRDRDYIMTRATRRNFLLRLISLYGEIPFERLGEWTKLSVDKVLLWQAEKEAMDWIKGAAKEDPEKMMDEFVLRLIDEMRQKEPTEAQRLEVRLNNLLQRARHHANHGVFLAQQEAKGLDVSAQVKSLSHYGKQGYAAARNNAARPHLHGGASAPLRREDGSRVERAPDLSLTDPDAWA